MSVQSACRTSALYGLLMDDGKPEAICRYQAITPTIGTPKGGTFPDLRKL